MMTIIMMICDAMQCNECIISQLSATQDNATLSSPHVPLRRTNGYKDLSSRLPFYISTFFPRLGSY